MQLTQEYFDQQLANLATKKDLEDFATKADLEQLASKFDLEGLRDDFRAMKTNIAEIKETLTGLDQRDKEDSDVFAKTVVQHDERLKVVEREIKQLKLKQA